MLKLTPTSYHNSTLVVLITSKIIPLFIEHSHFYIYLSASSVLAIRAWSYCSFRNANLFLFILA